MANWVPGGSKVGLRPSIAYAGPIGAYAQERLIAADPDFYLNWTIASWLGEGAALAPEAMAHYRAAFRLEHGTVRAQKAWNEAWRLAAGLPPTSGRYFCVYD